MSREEKEKLLNEKMENIRKRNEELRKRHEEIEADKKNADKFSSTVTMDKVKPYVMKTPRPRTEKPDKPKDTNTQPPIPRPSDIMPSRQRLSEDDGPPPDPSYRFLSDPDRDGNERDKKRDGRGKNRGKHGIKGQHERGEEGNPKNWEGDTMDMSIEGSPLNDDEGGNKRKEHGRHDQHSNDQKHGMGRGRGRGRGGFDRDRANQDPEYWPHEEAINSPREGNSNTGRGKEKGGSLSFASRDIRYYPDDDDDQQKYGSHEKMRGRQNYSHWRHSEEGGGPPGHRKGNFGHRGRGRGRREYERWKAERAAIDEARLTRGRTDGGSWRREWDLDKMNQGETNDSETVFDPRQPRSKKKVPKVEKDKIKPQLDEQGKNDASKFLEQESDQMISPQHSIESPREEDRTVLSDNENEAQEVIYIDDSSSDVPTEIQLDNDRDKTNVMECCDKDALELENDTNTTTATED